MKQLTFLGHPLHPQLVGLPLGLFPFSAVMDGMYLATGKTSYAKAAWYSLVGGYASGWAAAAAGIADYLTISPGGPMKKDANVHGFLNASAMVLYTVNLALRKRKSSGALPAVLSMIGVAGLFVSAWYGGHLVYQHGMRVFPATERPQPEARLPGDRKAEQAFHRLSELAPAGGPGREV